MRLRTFGLVLGSLAVIAASSLAPGTARAQVLPGGEDTTESDTRSTEEHHPVVTNAYEAALQLMAKGKCAEALPILKAYVARGAGNEVAGLEIGRCYLAMATKAKTASEAQTDEDLGVGWIVRTGDAGLRDSQEELVRLYLDGRYFMADPPEAGKWYLLWKRNVDPVGEVAFDAGLMAGLRGKLSLADWHDAEERAREWHPVIYTQAVARRTR